MSPRVRHYSCNSPVFLLLADAKRVIDELYVNDLEGAREYGYSEAVMSGNFFRFLGGAD